MFPVNKRTIISVGIITLVLLTGLVFILGSNRYYLQASGNVVYKIDRWTGKTWLVTASGEKPVGQLVEKAIEKKGQLDFPLTNLTVSNLESVANNGMNDDTSCYGRTSISGTITNNDFRVATRIGLRANFSAKKDSAPFHYVVFSAFDSPDTQIQPNSSKSFSSCLDTDSSNILKNKQWWFNVEPFSAKVY